MAAVGIAADRGGEGLAAHAGNQWKAFGILAAPGGCSAVRCGAVRRCAPSALSRILVVLVVNSVVVSVRHPARCPAAASLAFGLNPC
jgi:hypothetical protein